MGDIIYLSNIKMQVFFIKLSKNDIKNFDYIKYK